MPAGEFEELADNYTQRQSQVFHERLQTGVFVFATANLYDLIGCGVEFPITVWGM